MLCVVCFVLCCVLLQAACEAMTLVGFCVLFLVPSVLCVCCAFCAVWCVSSIFFVPCVLFLVSCLLSAVRVRVACAAGSVCGHNFSGVCAPACVYVLCVVCDVPCVLPIV